ncbi:ApaG domain [Paulownia witches'-broom phytoplasma]|uniref:ApaG domain n=1 Tax=Paulownia witches'-broom phytoplasma TaxID=39647 RepID=A0ABX8TNK5_9MOLU|nr:ApaG domain [Paulownia witches'-broom phytoplasma]
MSQKKKIKLKVYFQLLQIQITNQKKKTIQLMKRRMEIIKKNYFISI